MKATHQGHCQVCNALQKLPQGVLAKHGYQVAGYGFFNGVCFGSGHLPLEQDTKLVVESINWAGKMWLTNKTEALIWSQPTTAAKGWFHVYVRSAISRSYYKWEYCELEKHTQTINGRDFEGTYIKMDGKWENGMTYSLHGDLLDIANELNARYVDRELCKNMRDLNRYMKDQQYRIETWHEQPLIPITERVRTAEEQAVLDARREQRNRRTRRFYR